MQRSADKAVVGYWLLIVLTSMAIPQQAVPQFEVPESGVKTC
jgi:hypothetical protein